jgi:dihydropteroate synthase
MITVSPPLGASGMAPPANPDVLAKLMALGRPLVMGILNVTPDSFSDGGVFFARDAAVAHAGQMIEEGADIIDVGAESTRPYGNAVAVTAEEELRRLEAVLPAAVSMGRPVSIDTMKATVAAWAFEQGAAIVNDVWGLQRDPDMAGVVARYRAPVIVMHNRESADPHIDIMADMAAFFERSLAIAEGAGIGRDRIVLDPGVGFGKTRRQNHSCIWNLDRFRRFGAPILVGLSRKSFIGGIIDAEVGRRLPGTLAADTIALTRGASVLRVHDVAENRAALAVFAALEGAAAPSSSLDRANDGRTRIVLALGGNLGDKALSLRRALGAIASEPKIELTRVSRFYRTPPWGKTDQDWFVNACALGLTRLAPEALLDRMKALEVELGRVSTERWGPRVIDIDLIAYGDIALKTERLTLPHPELFNRAFVLAPLAEIAPDLVIAGARVRDAAASLQTAASEIIPLD